MANATYELAILLSLRDVASGRLDRFGENLRARGKDARGALQQFEAVRKSIGSTLAVGGVGVVTLAMLKKGVDAAGEFETAVLGLKSAYQESAAAGSLSVGEQEAQLRRLSTLSKALGNDLQGNTQNYVEILVALKKAGLDTETVLNGAGKSAAYLANVSGALLEGRGGTQAKELGQFGKMFKLQSQDFERQVNLFSALKDRFDIDSSELIESAKYFQNTANSLKLTGIGGAEETSKLFALVKRTGGLEGSQAGTSATSFFQQFIAKADQRAKIKKATGLDIQLFDKKGEFLGLENAFKEMEKFRKFSSEKRLSLLNEIFGEQGGKVAGVMVEAGADGWRNVTAEAAKAVPVQEKINQQMATYSAKMEAVKGTLDNIKATTFTPLLNTIKPALDGVNSLLGSLQQFGDANPRVASVGSHLIGIGALALTAYSGIKMLTTGWKLWRIAATIGASEKGLLAFLSQTKTESAATGTALQTAATRATAAKAPVATKVVPTTSPQMQLPWADNMRGKGPVQVGLPFTQSATAATNNLNRSLDASSTKVTGLRGKLLSMPRFVQTTIRVSETGVNKVRGALSSIPTDLKIGLTLAAIGFTIEQLMELKQWSDEKKREESNLDSVAGDNEKATDRMIQSFKDIGQPVPKEHFSQIASTLLAVLNKDRELEYGVAPERESMYHRFFMMGTNPYSTRNQDIVNEVFKNADTTYKSRIDEIMSRQGVWFRDRNQAVAQVAHEETGARFIRGRAPELKIPEVMSEFREQIKKLNLGEEATKRLNEMLQRAFPESFAKSSQAMADEVARQSRAVAEGLGQLQQGIAPTHTAMTGLYDPVTRFGGGINSARAAAESFAHRVNNLEITVPAPTVTAPGGQGTAPAPPPQSAVGSIVQRDGVAHVHKGNVIFPARLSRRSPGDWIQDVAGFRQAKREPHVTAAPIQNFASLRAFNTRGAEGGSFRPSSPVASLVELPAPRYFAPSHAAPQVVPGTRPSVPTTRPSDRRDMFSPATTTARVVSPSPQPGTAWNARPSIGKLEVNVKVDGRSGNEQELAERIGEEVARQVEIKMGSLGRDASDYFLHQMEIGEERA